MTLRLLFTVPKRFDATFGPLQDRALASWRKLDPPPLLLLLGDDPGVSEAARRHGAAWIGGIPRTAHGTPRVDGIFDAAERFVRASGAGTRDRIAYVNSDILLTSDLPRAAARLGEAPSLLIGGRTDLAPEDLPDPTDPAWEELLRRAAAERGRPHGPTGIDFFVHPPGVLTGIPPFALGRTTWDNALVGLARRLRLPIIDATAAVLTVHQDHPYTHIAGAHDEVWKGAEAGENVRIAREAGLSLLDVRDADRIFLPVGERVPTAWDRFQRGFQRATGRHPVNDLIRPALRRLAGRERSA